MSQVHGSSILNKENPNKAPDHLGSNVFTDLLSSTFYTVIGYVCLDVVFGISLHFIAQHNDPNAVAGLGLAFTTVNVLLIPMALGTNQSLNVHSAQALGAKKPKLAQSYFTLTVFIHLMYFIPFSIILILIKPLIAKTINEDDREATSDASQIYLYYLLPSTLFAILYECMKSYMIANKIQIFAVFMFIQLGTAALHTLWCYLFIDYWDIGGGIAGAGLAIICTEVLNCVFCLIAICATKYKKQVFSDYKFKFTMRKKEKKLFSSFLRGSIPIIGHIYADFFVFFLLNFIAVGFGSDQLNAQLALSNTSNFYYKFPISLSLALMTFVGNEMGAKNIKRAKRYSWVGVLLFIGFTTIFLSALSFFKETWAEFYSAGRQEITDLILEVYPIFVFGFFVIDGLQGTLTGILKGIERKDFVTYSTLLVYYLIGIPLVVYFAYDFGLGDKVYGIWLAFGIVNAILAVLYLILTFTTNWSDMSRKICQRIEDQHKMQNLNDSLNKDFEEDPENLKKKRKVKSSKVQQSKQKKDENEVASGEKKPKKERKNRRPADDDQQFSLQATEPTKITKQEVDTVPIMS
ncbi:unnamed protein product (macronuclear) [Paramecium tetraurelia]|uniref:Uncharacterized protein n=1 Tax=Paramecium tetraurelia TaxID=5888 RepID=A0EG51_PARTE|nr:uncharacterized protein GSPATT00026615001 [Paramecium tetraurelia]CAK94292.1 unnamed protein product [Paramecium tetraurelia]|eukprot:XP_001461665.1 hypothetical protein (macronuclear) [Paramecium tetraurelia strain d4-2]